MYSTINLGLISMTWSDSRILLLTYYISYPDLVQFIWWSYNFYYTLHIFYDILYRDFV
jgi:hypothetical protein